MDGQLFNDNITNMKRFIERVLNIAYHRLYQVQGEGDEAYDIYESLFPKRKPNPS
jgi:hypothetical protein